MRHTHLRRGFVGLVVALLLLWVTYVVGTDPGPRYVLIVTNDDMRLVPSEHLTFVQLLFPRIRIETASTQRPHSIQPGDIWLEVSREILHGGRIDCDSLLSG